MKPWEEYASVKQSDVGPWTEFAPNKVAQETTGAPLSRTEKFLRGVKDPLDAGAQMLEQALPEKAVNYINEINNKLADYGIVSRVGEGGVTQQVKDDIAAYEARRNASGESGLDGYRMLGNIAATAPAAFAAPAGATLAGRAAVGAGTGAIYGASNPVTEGDDFWAQKAIQAGTGAAVGAAAPVVFSGMARAISPKASQDASLAALKEAGVKPTIGQAIGGRAAVTEEKLMSAPFVGGSIVKARVGSIESYNNSVINDALKHVGANVEGHGSEAVRKAGDIIGKVYDDAIDAVKRVKFDAKFDAELMQLRGMVKNLPNHLRVKFEGELNNRVLEKMGPQRSMFGDYVKEASSGLKQQAAKFSKSPDALQQELGDAFKQLENILIDQVRRNSPKAANALDNADIAYAKLVRIEGAAKSAMNNEGIFTPAQLNASIRMLDKSVRGRAVARGDALLQKDFGVPGQKIIGNKYPDSGTAGRTLITSPVGLALGAAGSAASSVIYSPKVQNALVKMVSERPESAAGIAESIRRSGALAVPVVAPLGNALLNY